MRACTTRNQRRSCLPQPPWRLRQRARRSKFSHFRSHSPTQTQIEANWRFAAVEQKAAAVKLRKKKKSVRLRVSRSPPHERRLQAASNFSSLHARSRPAAGRPAVGQRAALSRLLDAPLTQTENRRPSRQRPATRGDCVADRRRSPDNSPRSLARSLVAAACRLDCRLRLRCRRRALSSTNLASRLLRARARSLASTCCNRRSRPFIEQKA